MRTYLTLAFAMLCFGSPAYAWHEKGHKATAAIAYELLSPADQDRVLAMLRAHPRFAEDFAALMPVDIAGAGDARQGKWIVEQASIWPDLIQSLDEQVRRQYHRGSWHYINLPVWLTDDDRTLLDGKLDHNLNLAFQPPLRQNLNVVQALRGNLIVWHDQGASDADKAIALCWILHLTGDMHQPLHTVALFSAAYFPKGDRGGNSINVAWGDEVRNLHAVWDGLPTTMENLDPDAKTKRMMAKDVVNDAAIETWLKQHARLADEFVYTTDVRNQLLAGLRNSEFPDIKLSEGYLDTARQIARQQVNLAGHRIARLVN